MRALSIMSLVVATTALDAEMEINPVRRIVSILQKMQEKAKEEGRRAEAMHTKFACYCKKGASSLNNEVNDQLGESKEQAAKATANAARVAQLNQEVAQHKKDREDAKASIDKADAMRKKELAEYQKNSGDLGKNVASLGKAINALKKGMGKSFLQSRVSKQALESAIASSLSATETERQTVLSFLASPYGDYQAASGEIVGILEEMRSNMEKDLGSTVDEEKNAAKAHAELIQAKEAEIAAATKAIEKKQVRSGELAVEATQAKNAAANAGKEASENQEFMANLGKTCAKKDALYEVDQKKRQTEVVAIGEVIHILNNDDALDLFKKKLPSPASFSQSYLQTDSPNFQREVDAFAQVKALAAVSERPGRLSLIAYMLRVGKVDFTKVVKMIDDMVKHLIQEQKDDAEHLDYCNKELDSSGDDKKELERNIKDHNAAIDELKERISKLVEEMKTIKDDMEKTKESMADATEQRQKENAEFKHNMVELNACHQLLEKAKNRLNKFYNPALYKPPPQRELTEEERVAQNMGETIPTDAPKMIHGTQIAAMQKLDIGDAPKSGAGFKKMGSKAGGVTALMDMLIKDLDAQIQEEEHDDQTAQRDYESTMSDSKKSLEDSTKSMTQKENEHADARENLNKETSDRADANKELESTNEKIAALHKSCDFLIANFAYRKEARTREVEGLRRAKAVLSGADYTA